MIGTWYFQPAESQDRLTVSPGELDSMLHELNSGFEDWNFRPKDVRMFHIGQLPAHAAHQSEPQPITSPLIAESVEFEGRILGAIAVYHVLGERMTQAQEALVQIRHPGSKDLALSNIALAQLKIKRFDEAIGMVKQMSGAEAKAQTYQQIAAQLIEEKRNDLAKAALAIRLADCGGLFRKVKRTGRLAVHQS